MQFPLEQLKLRPPRQLAQLLGWTKYFRHRQTIKLYNNKIDCYSLERFHAVLTEVNSEF